MAGGPGRWGSGLRAQSVDSALGREVVGHRGDQGGAGEKSVVLGDLAWFLHCLSAPAIQPPGVSQLPDGGLSNPNPQGLLERPLL